MFQIRSEQFKLLTGAAEARFLEKLEIAMKDLAPDHVARLQESYRPRELPKDADREDLDRLALFLKDTLEIAEEVEIDEAGDQAAFVCLMAGFDEYEPKNKKLFAYVGDVINREGESGALRMSMIEARLADLSAQTDAAEILRLMHAIREAV